MTTTDIATLAAHAGRYAANPTEWPLAPRFSPTGRWYARLATADDHEAWLLTWLPGQGTDWHDHGGAAGAFIVVEGQLTEETVLSRSGVATPVSHELRTGTTRRFGRRHIHRVTNLADQPAISVHVYAPALTTMTRYSLTAGQLTETAIEQAGADW